MVKGFVLDCSIVGAWFFKDEYHPDINRLQETVRDEGAFVPALWPTEVTNAFLQAVKQKRLAAAQAEKDLALIGILPINVDRSPFPSLAHKVFALAQSHSLTAYDAAYLELAMRLNVPLATKDEALRVAAAKQGIPLLPEKL